MKTPQQLKQWVRSAGSKRVGSEDERMQSNFARVLRGIDWIRANEGGFVDVYMDEAETLLRSNQITPDHHSEIVRQLECKREWIASCQKIWAASIEKDLMLIKRRDQERDRDASSNALKWAMAAAVVWSAFAWIATK